MDIRKDGFGGGRGGEGEGVVMVASLPQNFQDLTLF